MEQEGKLKTRQPACFDNEIPAIRKGIKKVQKHKGDLLQLKGQRNCTSFNFKKGSMTQGLFFTPWLIHLIAEKINPINDIVDITNPIQKCDAIIRYLRLLRSSNKKTRNKREKGHRYYANQNKGF